MTEAIGEVLTKVSGKITHFAVSQHNREQKIDDVISIDHGPDVDSMAHIIYKGISKPILLGEAKVIDIHPDYRVVISHFDLMEKFN